MSKEIVSDLKSNSSKKLNETQCEPSEGNALKISKSENQTRCTAANLEKCGSLQIIKNCQSAIASSLLQNQSENQVETIMEKTCSLKTIKDVSSKTLKENSSKTPVSLISTGSMVCRICQTNSTQEPLISPCHCKGSMAYVHLSCLERWLNQSSRCYCELCMYHFNAVQTKRYGLYEGLKLWIGHPRNRSHVQSDVLIGVLLTIITVGLIVVCLLGMEYFIIEAKKFGFTKFWMQAILAVFLSMVIFGYFITMYLLVKDQIIPWYTWWKQTVDVRLLLTPSVARGTTRQLSKEAAVSV